MPLFPEGDNNPIDIYPIIPSLDGTELIEVANKGTTKLYASTGQIADFVTSAEHDVTATAVITDNGVVRGDGGARGVQGSGVTIDDSNNVSGAVNLTQTGYHDLTEIAAPASPAANVARTYAVDDGAGVTTAAMKDSAGNISPLSHFKQAGTGAISRSFYNKNLWRVDAEDYGDVSTDALGCINRAITYVNGTVGGGEVHFEAREYSLTGPVVQKTGVRLVGKGSANTRLKLATNANSAVIETLNFSTLLGTGSLGGPSDFAIVGMTLDGNGANQNGAGTEINGMSLYGFRYLIEDVIARDAKRQGLRAEWGQFGEFAMEATIRRLKIDICGRHGMWWRGPHDSYGEDIMIVDASQETDDAYDGLLLEGFGTGKWVNVHPWHRSTVTNRMARSARVETGANEFIGCNFEGGRQCLLNHGDRNTYRNIYIFAGFSTDPMAVIKGSHLFFEARIEDSVPSGAACLQIGEAGGGNELFFSHLDVMAITAATNAVVVTNDGGRNTGIIKTISSTNAFSGTFSTISRVAVQRPDATLDAPFDRVTAGNSVPIIGTGTNQPKIQALGTDQHSGFLAARFSADANNSKLVLGKSRNATIGSHTIVQNNDVVASIDAIASDGTVFQPFASIKFSIDGTPGAGDMPGRVTIETSPDGSAATTERIRFDSQGLTGIVGSFGRAAPVTKTGNFSLAATENWVIVNQAGSTTVTLPAASSFPGREVTFKTIQAQTLVSNASNVAPRTDSAAGTAILAATDGAWATLVSDGTNWIIMAGTP